MLLIDNGIDINIKQRFNDEHVTALWCACKNLHYDVIKRLISHPMIKNNIDAQPEIFFELASNATFNLEMILQI